MGADARIGKAKPETRPPFAVVLAAAGAGKRIGGLTKKQFIKVGARTMLRRALDVFLALEEAARIVVVLPPDELERFAKEPDLPPGHASRVVIVCGGSTRQESVYNGLCALEGESVPVVAIHDAARPLVSPEVIRETVRVAGSLGVGAVACAPVMDTVKRARNQEVETTVDRRGLWLAQTPQSFPLDLILKAYRAAREQGFTATDDSSLCERLGLPVRIVSSDTGNLKVTTAKDLAYLEYCIKSENRQSSERAVEEKEQTMLRVGEGYDVHPLVQGRPLVLGGVPIPYGKGLTGHSDADVLLHAVADSLLGAAALGDLGTHFPDTDPAYKNADSRLLLARVKKLLDGRGFETVNLDATVIAEQPRLAPYIEEMRRCLAGLLEIGIERISIKATTHEKLGALGRGEGIAARAITLVKTKS